MKKIKNNLSEELKKFKLLSEYDFYVPESYEETTDSLLGEEDPADSEDAMGDTNNDSENIDSKEDSEEPIDFSGGDSTQEQPTQEPTPIPAEPQDDEVELDVTELVQGTKDAKASSNLANQQLAQLNKKFDKILATAAKIDIVNQKIDSLEYEVEKRNPTEVEKLEMRSLDSFPFNIKLTDYWSEKEGKYDVMDKNSKPNEYVLTNDDVEKDFNDLAVRDSFEDFDEEDI